MSQILIFKRPQDTAFYIFQDLAFVPISVLIVTLILDQLLRMREKRAMLKKMNMVIGAFFSEVGTDLLKSFPDFDQHQDAYPYLFSLAVRTNPFDPNASPEVR